MAQHDYTIANQTFPNTRQDLNNSLSAIVSNNSGATEPSTTYAYQWWYDETTDTLKMRNSDNDAWITMFTFNQTTDTYSLATDVELTITENLDLTGSATISGDLTVDTNTLYVDSTNNRVGIGTSSPASLLHLESSEPLIRIKDSDGSTYHQIFGNTTDLTIDADRGNTATSNIIFRNDATERMRIDSSGRVGIGTSSPSAKLHCVGDHRFEGAIYTSGAFELGSLGTGDRYAGIDFHSSGSPLTIDYSARLLRDPGVNGGLTLRNAGTGAIFVIANTGGVSLTSGATSWSAVSDEREKDIIEPITNATDKISSMRAVIGKYKDDKENTRRSFLIAQDVNSVFPEAVGTLDDEQQTLTLRYTEIIPLLVASIKELKADNDELRARIETLENA